MAPKEDNVNDMVSIDILDQIHSYLLHSFDTGYRLTKDEQKSILNENEEKQNAFQGKDKIITRKVGKFGTI